MPASFAVDRLLNVAELIHELLAQGFIHSNDADRALSQRHTIGVRHPLTYLAAQSLQDLSRPGHLLELENLTLWLAHQAGQAYWRIDPVNIDVGALTPLISHRFAQCHGILAIAEENGALVVASAQPYVDSWVKSLAHAVKRPIKRAVANPDDIVRFTREFYRLATSVQGASHNDSARPTGNLEQLLELSATRLEPGANDAPIIDIVDWVLNSAFAQRASDIHIEPRRDFGAVRFRIDGLLHPVYQFPAPVSIAVISRLKSLGRMNVAEKRKPQDGRLKTRAPDGTEVELRLSTLPTAFGEKMVMRIFDPQVLLKTFDDLGFSPRDLQQWQALLRQPNGIILVTGPTGSGKTTTLYTTLKKLASDEVNLCTLEDPVEMVEPAFNQMQVQHNIGLTFASGLRALLRQDPDIIMIGEIRDLETAEMAIQAALTGHLVLSTLHTNDAASAISRLLELGVPHYLVKATVLGVMAQRLVRILCPGCKVPEAMEEGTWTDLTQPWKLPAPATTQRPTGCLDCRDTGYRGRAGIYEILQLSAPLKALITPQIDLALFKRQAFKEGMHSLRLSGAQKIAAGLTTLEEILRLTPSSEDIG